MKRLSICGLAALGLLLSAAQPASAHAVYVRSSPAADARLLRPPAEVQISWSEPIDARFSEIQVLDAAGKRVAVGKTTAGSDGETLVATLPPIGDGGYTVSWRVLSSVDGHETRGSYAFALGDAPLPELIIAGDSGGRAPTALELAGRWLGFAGIALVLGGGFFTLLIAARTTVTRIGFDRLIRFGAIALAVSALVLFVDQIASQARGDVVGTVTGLLASRQGGLFGLRLLAAGLAWELARRSRLAPRVRTGGLIVAGATAAVAAMLASHAAAAGEPVGMLVDLAHLAGVSAWAGTLPYLLVAALGRGRGTAEVRGAMVWRFSLVALGAIAVIVITGSVAAFTRLSLIWDLIETPYGLALSLKIVLLLVALMLGALNLFVHGPRLRAGDNSARGPLKRTVRIEIGLVALILVAAAFLTALVPPAQPAAAGLYQVQRIEGTRIELRTASSLPGRNRFEVRVSEGLRPLENVEKVLLRFEMMIMDMGQSELVATQRGPGVFVAEGTPTSMFGPWRAQVIVRPSGRADVRALFVINVAAPEGTAATTRIVSAPPYNVIVFTDPSQVVAGAPFRLSLVVVDATGVAVNDATLRGRVQGPETLELAETRAAAGRFLIEVAGLTAGRYRVELDLDRVGTRTGVSFDLEVGR